MPAKKRALEEYRAYVRSKIQDLLPVFARAAVGDFSEDINIPEEEDEILDLYSGVVVMVEAARRITRGLAKEGEALNEAQKLAQVGSWEWELSMRHIEWSPEMYRIYGRDPAAFKPAPSSLYQHAHPDDRQRIQELVEKSIASKQPFDIEFKLVRPSGEIRWVVLRGRIEQDGLGEITRATGIVHDITERQEIEQAKTEFLALAAHQLRAAPAIIKWHSEILLGEDFGELNDKQREYLDAIHVNNQRMILLINSLLNVSRLEMGTFTVEPKPLSLTSVLQTLINSGLAKLLTSRGTHVLTSEEGKIPLIPLDPTITITVLENILSNAIQYSPEKSKIIVHTKIRDNTVEVSVHDSGPGISRDEQQKVFSKLFRGKHAQQRNPYGSGIGLYMTKKILEMTGGKIWFESKENEGSTFVIQFPISGMQKKAGSAKIHPH